MFATITAAELGELRAKLYSAGHKFAEHANDLGKKALELPPLSEAHDAVWHQRAPFAALMEEMYVLAEEAETTALVLGANPYEAACYRFELISRTRAAIIARARKSIEDAEAEWDAAQANLRQYESAPGIPLPQYRDSWNLAAPAMSVQIND